ncbi:rhomboid family intramembrane serine protease [Pedobacter sp. GR22-6]|uniref:rhomboid family intramembrane serine protease n=1 Tax=Pedobacter sp. GR22-6 TaxID=3127957 RepID=UPI00307D508A
MNNLNIPPVVKNLLIINVLFFVATIVFKNTGIADLRDILGVYYFDSSLFKVWQLLTYMFMHVNFMHLFSNMFALFMFGGMLEKRWGAKRFLNYYLITALGAVVLQMGVQAYEVYHITGSAINNPVNNLLRTDQYIQGDINIPNLSQVDHDTLLGIYGGTMMGASGAVFGVLVAFGMLYPNIELMMLFFPVPIKAKYFVIGYVILELSSGVARVPGDSVAHFAHLGGALIGFILVKFWKDKNNDRFYKYYE